MKFKVKLHPLFIVFVCLLICLGWFWELLAYIVTICLHELSHAIVAKFKGYQLNQYTFMPHGISLSGQNMLFTAKDEIVIALAGPFSNFCVAIFFTALWWLFPVTYIYTYVFVVANVITGIVNLLPIFPMDGGRVMLALLSKKSNRTQSLKILKIIGFAFSILFVILFVVSTFFTVNYTILVLGIFIFLTVLWEDKANFYVKTSFLTSKIASLKKGLVIREVAVSVNTSLYKLISQTNSETITNFKVLNDDLTVFGVIEESKLEQLAQIYPASATVKTILSQQVLI